MLNGTERLPVDWSRYRVGPLESRPTASLEPYRLTDVEVPRLTDAQYAALAEQVRAHGVREPLLVTPGGQVLDGQARLRAALAAGIAEVPVRVVSAPDPADYQVLAGAVLLARRHLTAPERWRIAAALRVVLEPLARQRQREALRQARGRQAARPGGQDAPNGHAPAAAPRTGDTREAIARAIGVSPRTAGKLQVLDRHASDELRGRLLRGEVSVDAAYREARGLARPAAAAEGRSARQLAAELARLARAVERLAARAGALPPGEARALSEALRAHLGVCERALAALEAAVQAGASV